MDVNNKHIELREENTVVKLNNMEVPNYSIKDIEQLMVDKLGGNKYVSRHIKGVMHYLNNFDLRSGSGTISLLEILSLQIEAEERAERAEVRDKRLKKIVCAIVLFTIFTLGCVMAMNVAAFEITKVSPDEYMRECLTVCRDEMFDTFFNHSHNCTYTTPASLDDGNQSLHLYTLIKQNEI